MPIAFNSMVLKAIQVMQTGFAWLQSNGFDLIERILLPKVFALQQS